MKKFGYEISRNEFECRYEVQLSKIERKKFSKCWSIENIEDFKSKHILVGSFGIHSLARTLLCKVVSGLSTSCTPYQ
ncbi:hypothetical protein CR513_44758, partial [Mucuna pruriens]